MKLLLSEKHKFSNTCSTIDKIEHARKMEIECNRFLSLIVLEGEIALEDVIVSKMGIDDYNCYLQIVYVS